MNKIPTALQTDIFERVFHIAAYSNMNKEEKHMYDLALKHKWDSENKLDYATEQGILKGREEERNNNQQRLNGIVHYLHTQGKSVDEIASITQLSAQEIEEIIQLIV